MYSYLGRIRGQRGQATYLPLTAPFGSHRVLNLKPTPVRDSNFALHYCKRLAWSVSESLALPRVFCRSEAEVRSSSSRFSWGVVEQDLEGARVSGRRWGTFRASANTQSGLSAWESIYLTLRYVRRAESRSVKARLTLDELHKHAKLLYEKIAGCRVAQRPGRIEPRLVKRRPKQYKYMKMPRQQHAARLKNQ